VYPKIVTVKVQVAYFENVFSDWSIFKEAVLLFNQKKKNVAKGKQRGVDIKQEDVLQAVVRKTLIE
jgi:hypothetical protein